MSGLTDSKPVGGGCDSGDHLESSADPSRPPAGPQSQTSGLRFAGKRQVVIQNLDLTPLRLDDPPTHHISASSNINANTSSKPARVRLPPLTSIGAAEGSTDNSSVLRNDRGGANKPNDRMSTGPVDLAAAQRQLDDQQLDDSQRERIEEFLRCKKDIHELHPEDFTKISELGSGNWGVVSRVRYNRTNIIMAKKTIRLDIKHEVGTQILRELEVGRHCSLIPRVFILGYPLY
ncbi:unnamed protein product [Hydatigera taeniaeformis]|uniref:mitogen-activated protein kinase kinase n=1 Tax=Hydatigena taeniaeformis TaxID=6205 RepID=A0A0R3WY38_HYDTA|nr:unnamed protein product [Hydatigera taeniaeformis]